MHKSPLARSVVWWIPTTSASIDSPCECEHNNPDSLDARLFFTVVLAVAPAVTIDTAGATANTTVKNSRASRESGLLCSHSHEESIGFGPSRPPRSRKRLSLYSILSLLILYGVWHMKGGSGGGHILRESRAIVLQ